MNLFYFDKIFNVLVTHNKSFFTFPAAAEIFISEKCPTFFPPLWCITAFWVIPSERNRGWKSPIQFWFFLLMILNLDQKKCHGAKFSPPGAF